jgi:EmrB/QacA subfamily drug resistance transporter
MEQPSNKNSIVFVSILAAFLPPFMASSVTVALPTIGRDFSMPAAALSWIVTPYFLAIAACLIPFGKAGDLYGRRNIFLYGIIVFTAASFCAAVACGAKTLITFRVMQGIGGSMIFSTGVAMLTAAVTPGERGKMLGINVAATYIGLSLGPAIGGLLTQTFGWRSIFFVNVPAGLVMILFVLWKIRREKPAGPRAGFDFGGAIVYAVSLTVLMLGISHLPLAGGIALSAAGASGLAIFIWMESRTGSPVLTIGLFRRNRIFVFSNLAALASYSATTGAVFLISLYLQYVKGLSPKNTGLIMLSQPLVMALFSPFAGRLSDRIEPRIVASAGMGLTAASLFLFSCITETSHMSHIVMALILLGAGIAFFSSPNTSAIMGAADKTLYGAASSIVGTMRLSGSILSMSIAAMILSSYIGNAPVTPAHHPLFIASVKDSFLVFAALCTLGVFCSCARGRVTKKSSTQAGQEILID